LPKREKGKRIGTSERGAESAIAKDYGNVEMTIAEGGGAVKSSQTKGKMRKKRERLEKKGEIAQI